MKREKAYIDNRRKRILEILNKNLQVRVEDLSKILGVSLLTVRRDLQYLEEKKKLVRFYGGAKLIQSEESKVDEVQMYRELIARYAATLVENDDSIFVNTSSTALQILRYITSRNVTVITNNGRALECEHGSEIHIILTGGELRHPKEVMVGDFAIRNLQTVYAKKSFIGCSGISPITGMTTENANEVNINELMIDHVTQNVYILADHTKIGKNSSFISCPIDKVTHLITDEKAPEDVLALMREAGIQVYQVKKEDFFGGQRTKAEDKGQRTEVREHRTEDN